MNMAERDFLDEMIELIEGSDLEAGDKAFLGTMAKHHEEGLDHIKKHKHKLKHKHVQTFAHQLAQHYAVQHAWISGALGHGPPPPPAPPASDASPPADGGGGPPAPPAP